VKLSNKIKTRGGLDADKHIQKEGRGKSTDVAKTPLVP
jgi:hypothetical protein